MATVKKFGNEEYEFLDHTPAEDDQLKAIYDRSRWAPSLDSNGAGTRIVGWHRYVPERETEARYSIEEMLKRRY